MHKPATVEFFGPSLWKTLHSVAWTYGNDPSQPTTDEKADVTQFFQLIGKVLPCPLCREHYTSYLKTHTIAADNRESLVRWVFDLHNHVNTNKENPTPKLTWEEHEHDYTVMEPHKYSSQKAYLRSLGDPHFGREINIGIHENDTIGWKDIVMGVLLALAILCLGFAIKYYFFDKS